ncbi:pneumococcal-type histidine triad protein [Streptococcus sp. 20-1249]|uniref:pneumococcal-type histidine triad protein n=1 Tax=Streptococcus hepaticus TaxID=3349163 RepID=UPI003749F6C8
MKKNYIYGSVVAIILSFAGYQAGHYQAKAEMGANQNVAYIDGKSDQPKALANKEKTPDQVSSEEGIKAEQIVVKITDKGYVTSHGDHFHFFNGKVPYDAILSEELIMTDPHYAFKQSDVVNEVRDGYIIKVDGAYYLYLKPGSKRVNIRSKAQIEVERKKWGGHSSAVAGGKETGAHALAHSQGRYTTDDGYVFHPTDVIDDFGDAFLVPHGDHFHYIPKKDLSPSELQAAQAYWDQKQGKASPSYAGRNAASASTVLPAHFDTPVSGDWQDLLAQLYNTPFSQRHVEPDGLVFDPAQITRRLPQGVVVPHGNHFHMIPYDQMSVLEEKVARLIPIGADVAHIGQQKPSHHHQPQPIRHKPNKPNKPSKPSPQPAKPITQDKEEEGHAGPTPLKDRIGKPNSKIVYSPEEVAAAKAAGKYATSDGYIFDAKDIKEDLGDAYIIPHMMHEHWVPKKDLSPAERKAAEDFLAGKSYEKPASPATTGRTAQEIYESVKPAALIAPEDLLFGIAQATEYKDGTFVIPHIDHYHYVQLKWFDEEPELLTDNDKTYSLEEFLATAKYYLENPDKRPKKSGWGTDSAIHKEEETSDEVAADKLPEDLTAKKIFDRVAPAKIVPVEKMSYNAAYTVKVSGDYLIIPHMDHYHNIKFDWFDSKLYSAPEGYSLADFFATVKYYVAHPDELPKKEGWGHSSDYGHGVSPSDPEAGNFSPDEEPEEAANAGAEAEEEGPTGLYDIGGYDEEDDKKVRGPEMDTLEERLWAALKVAEEMEDGDVKQKISDAVDALFDRQNNLKVGDDDTIAKVNADLDALCEQYNFKA